AHGSMPEKGVNAVYKAARAIAALEQFDFNVARHAVLGAPTLNVGTVRGGLNINSVPDHAAIGIDISTIPVQSHAGVRQELESYLGPDVALRTLVDMDSVWTDPAERWIKTVVEVARTITGEHHAPAAAPYFTDASALLPSLGAPATIILGPGELAQAHQTN